jgi:hypothetical protein
VSEASYGEAVRWQPAAPRIGLLRLLISWAVLTASVYVACLIAPGVALDKPGAGRAVDRATSTASASHRRRRSVSPYEPPRHARRSPPASG